MNPRDPAQVTEPATLSELISTEAAAVGVPALAAELSEFIDDAARTLFARFPWDERRPWHVGKATLSGLEGCRRRAVLANGPKSFNRALAVGTLADAAFKSHVLSDPGTGRRVDAARARLAAAGHDDLGTWLDSLSSDRRHHLYAEAEAAAANLGAFCPDPRSLTGWLRVDQPLSVPLLDGALVLSGRPDLTFWGPPTRIPSVLVEVKGRDLHQRHRTEMTFYALLATLRDRQLPGQLIVLCGSGEYQAEQVTEGDVRAAALRVVRALETAEALAIQQAARQTLSTTPSGLCRWCHGRFDCDQGRFWLEANGLEACLDPVVDPDELRYPDEGFDDDDEGLDEPL